MSPSTGGGTKISWLLLVSSSWEYRRGVNTSRMAATTTGRQRERSNIEFPIQIRENIVSPLTIRQEFLVNRSPFELVVQPGEPQNMILRSFCSVIPRSSGFHQ